MQSRRRRRRCRHLADLWAGALAAQGALPRFWQADGEPIKKSWDTIETLMILMSGLMMSELQELPQRNVSKETTQKQGIGKELRNDKHGVERDREWREWDAIKERNGRDVMKWFQWVPREW